MDDPFKFQGERLPIQSVGVVNNWQAITPPDRLACLRLGERASRMLVDFAAQHPERRIVPPHPTVAGMDFALVHLHQRLDLRAFEAANDLDFIREYIVIAQHINRTLGRWPTGVALKFYDRSLLHSIGNLFTIKRRETRDTQSNQGKS